MGRENKGKRDPFSEQFVPNSRERKKLSYYVDAMKDPFYSKRELISSLAVGRLLSFSHERLGGYGGYIPL